MVDAYSRLIMALLLPSRTTGDLLAGMWQLLSVSLGAVRRCWCGTTRLGSISITS